LSSCGISRVAASCSGRNSPEPFSASNQSVYSESAYLRTMRGSQFLLMCIGHDRALWAAVAQTFAHGQRYGHTVRDNRNRSRTRLTSAYSPHASTILSLEMPSMDPQCQRKPLLACSDSSARVATQTRTASERNNELWAESLNPPVVATWPRAAWGSETVYEGHARDSACDGRGRSIFEVCTGLERRRQVRALSADKRGLDYGF